MKAIRTRYGLVHMFVTHRPTLTLRHTVDLSTSCRPVASLPALGPWAHPAERGSLLENIYRVSLTVDLCKGNEIITFLNFNYALDMLVCVGNSQCSS